MRILLVLLVSCGSGGLRLPTLSVDSELSQSVQRFRNECRNSPIETKISHIRVGDLRTPFLGQCNWRSPGRNEIVIAKHTLALDSIIVDGVMYHELGHCLLDLQHVDNDADIMHPVMRDAATLHRNWDELTKNICGE